MQEVKQRDHVILCFYLPDTFFIRTCLRGMWHPRSIHTTSRQTVKKSHSGKHLWYRGSRSSQRVVGIWRNCMVSLHIILYFQIHAAFSISVEAARFEIEKKPCICFMTHRLLFIFVLRIDLDYHIMHSVHAACISSLCFFVYRTCCIFMLILTSAYHPQVRSVFHTSVQK